MTSPNITTTVNGVTTTVRNTYDADNNFFKTETLPAPISGLTSQQGIAALNNIAGLITAIQGGKPLPILTSGTNLLKTLSGGQLPVVANVSGELNGISSGYNLHNAFAHGGNTLGKISATLNRLNYVNNTLPSLPMRENQVSVISYELSSCLRSIYRVYSTKMYLNEAANGATWKVAA